MEFRLLPDADLATQEWQDAVKREEPTFIMEGTMRKHRRWPEIVVAANNINFDLLEERIERSGKSVRLLTETPETLLFFVNLNGPRGGIAAGFERADDAFAFALLKAEQKGVERVREVFTGSDIDLDRWLGKPHSNLGGRTPRIALREGVVEETIASALADQAMAA